MINQLFQKLIKNEVVNNFFFLFTEKKVLFSNALEKYKTRVTFLVQLKDLFPASFPLRSVEANHLKYNLFRHSSYENKESFAGTFCFYQSLQSL